MTNHMNTNQIYTRSIEITAPEAESRTVSGYAVVFDERSIDLGGFYEIIRSTAITPEFLLTQDVIATINHDPDTMLARYTNGEGTLSLTVDAQGLFFSFECPDTARGNELLYNLRAGNLRQCSFRFAQLRDDKECRYNYKDADGNIISEVRSIYKLLDVSIVTRPAYEGTSVEARSADEAIIENMKKEEEQRNAEYDKMLSDIETKRLNIRF